MAPIATEPVRRPKNRKDEILSTAAELFAARGYAAVSVDDIGARVGITGPALYRHFRGKQAVITAILDATMEALAAAASDVDTVPDTDPAAPLRGIISRTTTVAMDAPAAFGVWLREARNHDPTTMPAFMQLRRRTGRIWHVAERLASDGLSTAELRIREEAVVAVINAFARRPTSVSRLRVEELAVACAMATVLVPPTDSLMGSRRPKPRRSADAWSAPRSRQDTILGVAVPMFRTHGFAGVSMDQIGEAAGITGPSVYRYYESKAAILVDAFDRTDTRVAIAADRALSDARSATEALGLLVAAYAEIALDSADLVVVTTRETSALPSHERRRQALRGRANADTWARVLGTLRPELADGELRLVVRAMFGVLNQLVQLSALPTVDHLAALARAVAMASPSRTK